MLDERRLGRLSEQNYNFLHGLPTNEDIVFWYAKKDDVHFPEQHKKRSCSISARCEDCNKEIARRNRFLRTDTDPMTAAQKLADPAFKKCVLITPFNKAVFQFAVHRAQRFAAQSGHQLFWMQAVDSPSASFAESMSKGELQQMKQNWLRYHARKTEGILSSCPCCYDMPLRITHGNGYLYKDCGVHNGATCILKGWQLHEKDLENTDSHGSKEIILQALPKKLIVQMDRPLKKEYPGLPANHFSLSPVTVYWFLDTEGGIQIARKGFPVVPNFSMTVDGATGKTLETAIADLGSLQLPSTLHRTMFFYLSVSSSTPWFGIFYNIQKKKTNL